MYIAGALGSGMPLLVIAGLLPMIAWAFMRFRAEKAVGPFVAWGFLVVLLMGIGGKEVLYERQEAITTAAKNITSLSGGDYDTFVRGARQSCG